MSRVTLPSDITLEYDVTGPDDGMPLLLVMGFTAQMVAWDERFVATLVDAGFRVIRFDNRDCGLSTKFDGVEVDMMAVMVAAASHQPLPPLPYTLSDMGNDGIGLLDHLGIDRCHVAGASMGGMIVQTMAIEHPDRIASMTSIMSTTGERDYGQATNEAIQALLTPPPADRDAYIVASKRWEIWSSKKYYDPEIARARAAREYDRSFYPEGASRQMCAIQASGSRAKGLRELKVPTLVIHGRDDTLITPSGGTRTAELIDGAHLLMLADMGHDIPEPLWPILAAAMASHARAAG